MTENITEIKQTLEDSFNQLLKLNADLLKSLDAEQLKQVLPYRSFIQIVS